MNETRKIHGDARRTIVGLGNLTNRDNLPLAFAD
jgi:hypothetical protein